MTPAKSVRKFCLNCMGGKSLQVELCPSKCCPLVPYRSGHGGRVKRSVIKGHCLHCVGGVRADAVNCTDRDCALYPYRPGQVLERKKREPSPGQLKVRFQARQIEAISAPKTDSKGQVG